MPETFAKKYIKKLLDKVVLKKNDVSDAEEKSVDSHTLANVAPNPVDDYASVHLDLPSQSTVTIRVYSQSALAETLLKGKMLEPGKHSFSINAGNLNKGVYVCLIEINGVSYSRKFLKR
jgi:hypothetical protein